jgi:hypothetical protein
MTVALQEIEDQLQKSIGQITFTSASSNPQLNTLKENGLKKKVKEYDPHCCSKE